MHIDDCCGSSFSLVPLLFGDQVACAEYHLCAVRATLPERQRACCLLWKTSRVYGMVFLYRGSARYGSAQRRGSICCFLGPGHTAAGFFDYHRNRPHSATVVKDTVAECGRFLSRQRESIICPKRQIIDSASSCVSVRLGIVFEMRTARSG